jgi:ketosteroid isomerase-like protein
MGLTMKELAEIAFQKFANGLATGEWQPYLDLLAQDFVFWFPMGKYQGRNEGKEKATEFFNYVRTVYPTGLFATLENMVIGENTVVYEFKDEGLLFGTTEYKNRVAVAMDFKNGKITAYREYFGSDGKSF